MLKELTAIDLFSGCGGFSQGAKAVGIKVLFAANHWKQAVQVHANNFPNTKHWCQDLNQANFSQVPDHDILLASPCCQGHSIARGKNRPWHDDSRSTAWAVVQCADVKRPPFLVIENVKEFRKWEAFEAWKMALQSFGYFLSENLIDAANLGVPQHRTRLFIVGVHKSRKTKPFFVPPQYRTHKAAKSIIDWDEENWGRVNTASRSENTLRRIQNGYKIYGKEPFLIAYYGAEKGGRSIEEPLGTVTCRDRFALVHDNWMRMLNIQEYRRAMDFPKNYQLPEQKTLALHLLGNAVVPAVAQHVLSCVRMTA